MIGAIKLGLGKFMFTAMQPEACFIVVSWDTEIQEMFATIISVGLILRGT